MVGTVSHVGIFDHSFVQYVAVGEGGVGGGVELFCRPYSAGV